MTSRHWYCDMRELWWVPEAASIEGVGSGQSKQKRRCVCVCVYHDTLKEIVEKNEATHTTIQVSETALSSSAKRFNFRIQNMASWTFLLMKLAYMNMIGYNKRVTPDIPHLCFSRGLPSLSPTFSLHMLFPLPIPNVCFYLIIFMGISLGITFVSITAPSPKSIIFHLHSYF